MTRASEVLEIQHALTQVMTSWHMISYISAFMETTAGKDSVTYRVSFYPWAVQNRQSLGREEADSNAVQFCQSMRASLGRAPTYQVSAPMCALARTLTDHREPGAITAIQRRELPARDGFIWLDTNWLNQDIHDRTTSYRAVTWTTIPINLDRGDGQPVTTEGVRLAWWTDTSDFGQDHYYLNELDEEMRADITRRIGRLSLSHVMVCPFGTDFTRQHEGDALLAALHILWMLFDMEIATQDRPAIPRATRRRVNDLIHDPSVRVITLRRPQRATEAAHEERPVDWSCQWVVQGHGRHLEAYEGARHRAVLDSSGHCERCQGRGTWVRPYIKGPDGMPLKITAAVVNRLSR